MKPFILYYPCRISLPVNQIELNHNYEVIKGDMEVNDVTSWCVGMVVILKIFEKVHICAD